MKTFNIRLLTAATLFAFAMQACNKNDDGTVPPPVDPPVTVRPVTPTSSKYISEVFDYVPAPGQFINQQGLGTPDGAKALVGGLDALVTLGGFGGYVVFGFDHSLFNETGDDIGIYGNAQTGKGMEWSEPGIVMVSQDRNGNGKPDDQWYELAGEEYSKPTTLKNYRITYYNPKKEGVSVPWKDNQGKKGEVIGIQFHSKNNYYPAFINGAADSITFEGTLLPNTLTVARFITNLPVGKGYADNGSPEYSAGMLETGKGFNTFDISNAVDKNGNKVTLKTIDFVKVYTAQNCNGNTSTDPAKVNAPLGEISTEISGAVDLHIKK